MKSFKLTELIINASYACFTPTTSLSILTVSLALISTVYTGAAQAIIIPINSLLEVETKAAIAGEPPGQIVITETQGATTNPLIAEASNAVTNTRATSNATASWLNAGQGTVNFSEFSLFLDPISISTSAHNRGMFSYEFIADIDGLMTIDYDVASVASGSSSNFYLTRELFAISLHGDNGLNEILHLDQNSSGQFSALVAAGVEYHLLINRDILGVGTGSTGGHKLLLDATQSANFNWQIPSAIPVPAAIWLFGSGLIGLVGVSRCKNNKLKQ